MFNFFLNVSLTSIDVKTPKPSFINSSVTLSIVSPNEKSTAREKPYCITWSPISGQKTQRSVNGTESRRTGQDKCYGYHAQDYCRHTADLICEIENRDNESYKNADDAFYRT
jgi:hypothetical protein